MTNKNKQIFAGLIMMAALLSVSVTYETAFAQESEQVKETQRPYHLGTYLVGNGAVVGEDDQGWRSHFRMGIVESDSSGEDAVTEYEVKRGVFLVGKHDNRHKYSVIADTWAISVSPNVNSFDASGEVENREGEIFNVEISGEEISNLQHGTLYYVTGTATSSDGEVYNLFYISALIDRTPSIQTTPSGI